MLTIRILVRLLVKCSLNNEKLIFELDNKQVEYAKKIAEEACKKLD
jgi:hypothetical protein